MLAIPDWGVTPFAAGSGRDVAQIARELDAYNATAAAVCAEHNIAFIDTAPVSRARGGEAAMLADDGLHPSAALYTLWYEQAYPVAYRHLNDEVLP
ncbi:SGNH/GDSL hydrolase family protein [Stenotrophomonas sp. PS02289]|uniref:SGNH/GDSL hydrolase family protein n=1 Tax=Stenotrophomonas sp. PS02289 TaxID=2991422 RepID=UPI00249BA511|nr:SGNH/GDSL hydrolase family protein [Stenotrophomonas sp. PS02289]